MTICLLDDETSVLRAIGRLLASEGLASEKFTEAADLLAHVRRQPVALAVLDVRMPDSNGIEVLAELRRVSPQTQVIMISAVDEPGNRAAASALGAFAFFLKPFDDDGFLQTVHQALAAAA